MMHGSETLGMTELDIDTNEQETSYSGDPMRLPVVLAGLMVAALIIATGSLVGILILAVPR